jgi:hypothetical protein
VEDGLGLTSVTRLFAVITTLSLGEQRSLASLVFCHGSVCASGCGAGLLTRDLVLGVLLAVLALAVGSSSLGNVDLAPCQPFIPSCDFQRSVFIRVLATRLSDMPVADEHGVGGTVRR